jgi:hypothetical protein
MMAGPAVFDERTETVGVPLLPAVRARLIRYAREKGLTIGAAAADAIRAFLVEQDALERRRTADRGHWITVKRRHVCTHCARAIPTGHAAVYVPATGRHFCGYRECGPRIIAAQKEEQHA